MKDQDKTREQLISELEELRRRVETLETQAAQHRQSEADQEQIGNSLPVLVATAGFDGYYKKVNAAFEKILGWTEQESLSRPFIEFIHTDDHAAAVEAFGQLSSGKPVAEFVDRNVCKDGSHRWIKWTVIPLPERAIVYGIGQDITDRRLAEDKRQRAEEALRHSEERLALAASGGRLGMFEWSIATGKTLWNEQHARLLGLTTTTAATTVSLPCQYSDWAERVHPDDLPQVEAALRRCLSEHTPYEAEYRVVWPDGSVHWLIGRGVPQYDGHDRPQRMLGVIMDITAQKQAEESLKKVHDELEQIVQERTAELAIFHRFAEASTQAFAIADLTGCISYVNPALCRMSGYQPEDLIGKRFVGYYPEALGQRLENEIIPTVLREGQWAGEFSFPKKDGSIHPSFETHFVIRDETGAPANLAAVMTDITERRQMQEALRASEERYELAVQGAGVGIFDWDILTGKVYYSLRWKTLLGYEENDIGDGVEDWSSRLHPDERESIIERQDDFFRGASPAATAEYRLRHKDGSYRWIEASVLVVRDEDGRACRLVGSHEDITERKQTQEALERERQSLWKMLQASDHERQTISYEIHDGLAQYLSAANMQFQAYEAMRKEAPKEARKAYKTAVELVRQAHFEARRLISEVRPPIIDEIGLETAISHLVYDQRRRGGPKLECHSSVQFGRLPPILENALYRIAQEALTNACKHSKSKKVAVSMTQEGRDVRLEVQDWGIGFDAESVEKGHFGLEGIRQRVRLLGGRLKIESKAGAGTLVQAVVPIVERQN